MRIVEVRGRHIIAGGALPYKPELAEQVIEEVCLRAGEVELDLEDMFSEQDECPEAELIQDLSLAMVLKMSAPLFSETWLMGTVLDPADAELPTLGTTKICGVNWHERSEDREAYCNAT